MLQSVKQTLGKLINWGLPSSGAGISLHFFINDQKIQGIVSSLITLIVALGTIGKKFVKKVLERIEERAISDAEPLADLIYDVSKDFVIRLWWKITAQFESKYYRSLVQIYRDFYTEGFKIGLPVLDLEDVFVPLRVITEIPEKITGAMIQRSSEKSDGGIWSFLSQSNKITAYKRLAVIGPPGSGKTTLLHHLTLTYGKNRYRKYKAPKFIPILLYLRDIRESLVSEQPPTLAELITKQIKKLPAKPPLNTPERWSENQLSKGNCLVMLDGLDEVAEKKQRQKVSQWVNSQMKAYPQTAFIITSRPDGYRSAPIEQVGTVLGVLPFNLEDMQQFIQSWYLQTEIRSRAGRDDPAVRAKAKNNAEDLIDRIVNNRAIAEMAKNPLLVTMIATVHYCGSALPGRRVELYQKICNLLLGPRQEAKKINIPLTAEQNKSVLQVLALGLIEKQTREFTPATGHELIEEELKKVAASKLTPLEFLKQIKEVSGLLVEREQGIYEFAHLSFQEYLAAAQIKESQQEKLLVDNFDNSWWAETIRLYAAISDATNLIKKALENLTVNSLTLALDCREESLKVEETTRAKLEEILEKGLESTDPQIANLAAEVRLSRRLKNFLKIDENLEIDNSYISCVEYKLFVEEHLNSEEFHLEPGSAKNPITDISFENALRFCVWLSSKASLLKKDVGEELAEFYYRLPTLKEAQTYMTAEHPQLECWTVGGSQISVNGIRVVKTKIPSLFEFDVITINSQGAETQRERSVAQYFTEKLGNNVTLDMVAIPGGKFMMGAPKSEKGSSNRQRPQHEVTIQPFYMGKFPVTQAQWRAVANLAKVDRDLKANPSKFKGDRLPVEKVSWYDVVEFCKRLSRATAREYRLPSEAEWEYAARAGTTTPFHFGETITSELANYASNNNYADEPKGQYRQKTTDAGQFPPNAFGLYDMHGNVWEWCADAWHENYSGAPNDGSAWTKGGRSNTPVLRGGSWSDYPNLCRSAFRINGSRENRSIISGFRVVCGFGRPR